MYNNSTRLFGPRVALRNAMKSRGFSLLEVLVVTGIVATLSAVTVPRMLSTIDTMNLTAAATSVQGAIQSTRYLSIMRGYPYQVVLSSTTRSYQLANKPIGTSSFANVGSPVPFTGINTMSVTSNTLQFNPNGSVSAASGSLSFQITYKTKTRTINVSANGDVSVTTP